MKRTITLKDLESKLQQQLDDFDAYRGPADLDVVEVHDQLAVVRDAMEQIERLRDTVTALKRKLAGW